MEAERERAAPDLLDIVVAGAVLMELALAGRIDTDLERLVLTDSTPLEEEPAGNAMVTVWGM